MEAAETLKGEPVQRSPQPVTGGWHHVVNPMIGSKPVANIVIRCF
jgi:hypothetical protein